MTSSLFVHRRAGAGRPIVFLHGFASRGRLDWPDMDWIDVLEGRASLVIDLPAHGESPAFGVEPTSTVLDRLAEAVGADEIDLVGYSLGARIAWDLARRPGLRVHRLALGGLSAGEPFASVDLPAARASAGGGAAPADPLTGMIFGMMSLPGNRPADLLDLVEGLAAEPFDPHAGVPDVPTLLVGGIDDPMAQGIDDLAALFSDARVIRVPGDHLAALHAPEFSDAVVDFLND